MNMEVLGIYTPRYAQMHLKSSMQILGDLTNDVGVC